MSDAYKRIAELIWLLGQLQLCSIGVGVKASERAYRRYSFQY